MGLAGTLRAHDSSRRFWGAQCDFGTDGCQLLLPILIPVSGTWMIRRFDSQVDDGFLFHVELDLVPAF